MVYYGPNLGNDGAWTNEIGPTTDPHCAHSERETNPWWAVDLGIPLSVKEIFFRNRLDWCEYTLFCNIKIRLLRSYVVQRHNFYLFIFRTTLFYSL